MNPYVDGRWFRPVRGVGIVAIVFIWLATAVTFVLPFVIIHAIDVINEGVTDEGPVDPVVENAVATLGLTVLVAVVVYLLAGFLYWVWSWRARCNAEGLAGRRSQDLARAWTFWGWLCPIVNLWFPCQILLDIHRVSDLREPRRAGMVIAWWICLLGAYVVPSIVLNVSARGASRQEIVDRLPVTGTVASVVGMALLITAAVLITVAIRRISDWQSTPRERAPEWAM